MPDAQPPSIMGLIRKGFKTPVTNQSLGTLYGWWEMVVRRSLVVLLVGLVILYSALKLSARYNTNARDPMGRTPLHLAARDGDDQSVAELLSEGARLDLRDNNGYTPLHLAAGNGHAQAVRILVSHGADSLAKTPYGVTPLMSAAEHSHDDVLAILINESKRRPSAKDLAAPLIRASAIATVRLLISEGADVNYCEQDGRSLLHKALMRHDMGMARMLISQGANANAFDSQMETPLLLALLSDDKPMIDLLARAGANLNAKGPHNQTILHDAAVKGNSALVQLLLAKGAEIDERDQDGNTPLMNALQTLGLYAHDSTAVEILLEHGADVNACNIHGDTPLILTHRTSIARMLLDRGADTNAMNLEGHSSLHLHSNNEEYASLLIKHGAKVDLAPKSGSYAGYTPLHDVAKTDWVQGADFLIAHGANVNAQTTYGKMTPLHLAVQRKNKRMVELLISKGANLNIKDHSGRTPIYIASGLDEEIFSLLAEKGATLDQRCLERREHLRKLGTR